MSSGLMVISWSTFGTH